MRKITMNTLPYITCIYGRENPRRSFQNGIDLPTCVWLAQSLGLIGSTRGWYFEGFQPP